LISSSIFPLTPMGVLAPGSADARPSARPPIDVSRNFPALMSAESPPTHQKSYPMFRNPRMTFENTPLSTSAVRPYIGLSHVIAGSWWLYSGSWSLYLPYEGYIWRMKIICDTWRLYLAHKDYMWHMKVISGAWRLYLYHRKNAQCFRGRPEPATSYNSPATKDIPAIWLQYWFRFCHRILWIGSVSGWKLIKILLVLPTSCQLRFRLRFLQFKELLVAA
jgi:hypothetical protein